MPEPNLDAGQADFRARSPWAALTGVQRMHVHPVETTLQERIAIPGSKSFTTRAILLASVADGTSRLTGILRSDDAYWCLDAVRRLGIKVELAGEGVTIFGQGGAFPAQSAELYVGASGTVSRFLPGLLAASSSGSWRIDGSTSLRGRPMQPLLDGLIALGGDLTYELHPGFLPIRMESRGLRGGVAQISGETSSQFISGLMMAAPLAASDVEIVVVGGTVQPAYLKMTASLMETFGVHVQQDMSGTTFRLRPQLYKGCDVELEADASTAAYMFALAAVTGQTIRVTNLSFSTLQPDIGFLDILTQMGCHILRQKNVITVTGPTKLRGGQTFDLQPCSDQALTVAAIAPFADAPIKVTGVQHIRAHESNRIRAACENLARVGIRADEHEDGFTVHPGQPQFAALPSYDDHRVAMAFAVMGAAANGVAILDPGAVSKTCPTYFDLLRQLGVRCEEEA